MNVHIRTDIQYIEDYDKVDVHSYRNNLYGSHRTKQVDKPRRSVSWHENYFRKTRDSFEEEAQIPTSKYR